MMFQRSEESNKLLALASKRMKANIGQRLINEKKINFFLKKFSTMKL